MASRIRQRKLKSSQMFRKSQIKQERSSHLISKKDDGSLHNGYNSFLEVSSDSLYSTTSNEQEPVEIEQKVESPKSPMRVHQEIKVKETKPTLICKF